MYKSKGRAQSNQSTISSTFNPDGTDLLLILLSLVVDDVVEAELVDTLGGGDDAEPVTELLLLEVLLGPVWERAMVSHWTYMVL